MLVFGLFFILNFKTLKIGRTLVLMFTQKTAKNTPKISLIKRYFKNIKKQLKTLIIMKNEKIIEAIVDKINASYDDYGIERFLKQQEINSDQYNALIEQAKNKILEHKLKTYPRQNKLVFIFSLALFVALLLFFGFILPSLNIASGIIPLSTMGAICISLSGFYSILYYKSWKKDFIEKVGKPKLDLQTYFLVSIIPNVLLYFIISWSFISGSGYNLYKLDISIKAIKSLIK